MTRKTRTPVIALSLVVALLVALVAYLLVRAGDVSPAPAADSSTSGSEQTSGQPSGREMMEGIARFDEGDPLARGPVDAPVVMTVYSDFRCPFCAKFSREIEPLLVEDYVDEGELRIEWRDLPIFGEPSLAAARAGRAAADQDRFWEFTDAVFAAAPDRGHPDFDEAAFVGFAEEAGVPDLDRFRRDLASDQYDAVIQADYQNATSLGATSTPTFVVNGTGIIGARSIDTFRNVIDRELAG